MKTREATDVLAASPNCAAVFRTLASPGIAAVVGPGMTPTELARAIDIARSTVSDCLDRLVKAGVVECVNSDARKGRKYRLTVAGKHASERERTSAEAIRANNVDKDEVGRMFNTLKTGIADLQERANELGAQLRFYEMKFGGKHG